MLEINTFDKIDWEKIYLEAIKISNKNPDQLISVEVKKYYNNRSLLQNKYLWGIVYFTLSDYTGYTSEEWHEELTLRFLREDIALEGKNGKLTFHKIRSTTELTTVEFSEYVNKIRDWASMELGLYIPEPNEENILNSYKD